MKNFKDYINEAAEVLTEGKEIDTLVRMTKAFSDQVSKMKKNYSTLLPEDRDEVDEDLKDAMKTMDALIKRMHSFYDNL